MEKRTIEEYSKMLESAKNIIFRGAPGTGKTFLAKEIAAYIVSELKKAEAEFASKISDYTLRRL